VHIRTTIMNLKKLNAIKTSEILFLLNDLQDLFYSEVKICGKIDLKMNWYVKTPLHGQKGVARSGLWAPGFPLKTRTFRYV